VRLFFFLFFFLSSTFFFYFLYVASVRFRAMAFPIFFLQP
jgi:hypothetical protein